MGEQLKALRAEHVTLRAETMALRRCLGRKGVVVQEELESELLQSSSPTGSNFGPSPRQGPCLDTARSNSTINLPLQSARSGLCLESARSSSTTHSVSAQSMHKTRSLPCNTFMLAAAVPKGGASAELPQLPELVQHAGIRVRSEPRPDSVERWSRGHSSEQGHRQSSSVPPRRFDGGVPSRRPSLPPPMPCQISEESCPEEGATSSPEKQARDFYCLV